MKILVLNYEYPPLGGGAGEISKQIAVGLVKLGHQIVFITTWYNSLMEREDWPGYSLIRLKSRRKHIHRSNPAEMLSWIRKSKKYLKEVHNKGDFDICLANFTIPCGLVAKWTCNKFQLPYAIISHGHDIPWFFPQQMFFYHVITYFKIRAICREAGKIFLQSAAMKTNADRFTGKQLAEKNVIIPNGSDKRIWFPDFSNKAEKFTILFAGRLVRQKDPETFLKAIKRFSALAVDFEVRIIGDGPRRKLMEGAVKKYGLEEKVKFTGWIGRDELLKEYQTASIMVAPSLNEGMSMAMMEALACGLYIIATPVSRNTGLIKPGINGELVLPGDDKAICDALWTYYSGKFKEDHHVPSDTIESFSVQWDWPLIIKSYERHLLNIIGSV